MTSRKQLAINQRALYDDAVKNKMFWNATPSFQEFQRRLQNPKYVQTVQANYRAHGRSGDAFDTLSGFRDYFCVSDEDKQDMTQGVGNMIADTKARLAGQQRYNKLKQHQDKQRGRYGRLDLGVKNPLTNDNVVRDDATDTYLTSQGAEYAQEYEAARAQNHIDETGKRYTEAVERGDLPSAFEVQDEDGNYALMEDLGVKPGVHVTEKGKQQQLAGLVNTRKSVEEQYNALYRKLEEDFKRSAPFSLNTHSQYGIDDNDMRLQAYLNSNAQYRRLKAQLHQLDNAIGVGEEAVKGRAEERYVKNAKGMLGYAYRDLKSFGASALRGLWNAVSDVSTWDLGLQDLQDNMTLYTTVKKARQKGYKNLNDEERQMLDVAAKTGAYTAENQQYLGRGYKAGNVTGESLPFMVEMALNPASGLGEAVMSKYMRNAIAKYGKEAVRKEAWKYVTKKCGYRVAGDVLGAALMTGTTGSARTLADTYDRLTGDIKSTYDSDGKIVYDGTENEEKGILKAYLKAFGATAIENHSEFVGEYFNPLLKGVGTLTMKGWKKVNAKSANAFLDNLKDMGSTSTAKWLGNLFDKTQWHGTIGEYAEEVVGNIENALLVGDSTLDTKEGTGVFNLDQNIDTFLGVSLMGGFFSTLKTGAYVRDKVKGERKILMQQSLDLDNSIRYALGADPRLADKWKEWRVALAQGTDEEKKQALKEISENTNGNIKKAMYDYSANAQKLAGMDKATQGAIEDGTITPEQAQRDADIEQAHEEGLAAEGTARHDIQQEHQLRENSLARMLGISAEQLDRMEDEDIESMTGQNDALDTAIYDYQTSRERYQGVIDRATDEVEQAGIDAAHQIDLYTDHSTGQIRPCVIKGNNGKEDYQGYIVNGNIATHPDGAIDVSGSDKMILYFDPETGKIEHGDASTFASLGESADATVARQQAIDEAKQQAAQAQSRDIDGGVGEDGNVSEAMPTFPQSSDQEERNAADFDIGQVVNAETGEVIPVSFEGLAEGENAYLTGGRPDGKTKDRLKVTIVDAEGNVTNRVMKRGNVQVDGRMSAEDFRNAYEEAVSSRMAPEADINEQENNVDEEGVVAGDAAPSADKAATSEEEGAASEPAVRDKNGNPIYDKMPISATIADLYDGALDDAEIDGFVSAQIAEAEKAVEKMEKKKPKVGTDKAKYLADKKAWEEGLQEAQRKVQYWQDVKAEVEKITTPEDARGYEEELNGDAAQTAYRNGSDAAAYGAREVTAEFMQSGDVKITPESYRKETGFGAAEQRAMVGKISKGGKSIDKLAEDLEVFDRENYNGMYFGGDSSVAKDAILDYLSSPDSRKGVKKMQSEAEREYVEAYEAERDRYYQEKYHMSYEEYLVYSSQEMPELLRKYSNFDEQLFLERYADEIEAALQKREEQLKQEENGKEGNVSAGEESGHGRSNQVQSGERTDDIGRGEVGKDSAGEVGPRHEGVVESEAALGSGGSTNQQRIGRVQKETRADVADQTMTHDEAIAFIAAMENRAEVAPSVDLSIENWDSLFGLDGIVNTPIGKVKMGDNQFTKMMREDRHGKLGMVKPTLENPDAILEDASKAKAGDTEERPSSYIFVKAFKKSDGSRYYYFTSITVSKDGLEVVVSNQEKRKNAIANLLSKDKLVWKHADDVSDASDVAQGLYSSQGNVSDLATEGTDAPQTSMSNNIFKQEETPQRISSVGKDTNNLDTKQGNEEKSVGGEKEPMSPIPAMIDRMIEEQRVDDVSELLISSELKKAAEGIAGAFGMKVVYLKKVFIRSNDPAVEDFEGNGFVRNGVIYLSLKEADIAQFTFGHELLHQLKQIDADSYMRIRQKVIDVMGRKAFEMEVKARQMTYANVPGYTLYEDYAEEVIADTLGDIITHTDMLPDIARSLKDNPSLLDRLLNAVDNVRQYFRGKIGGALGDLVNDIRNTYEKTAQQGAKRDKFSLRLAEAKNNTDKNPSQAQKESGNYRKGHIRFGGYNYTIENPQGSYRSGVDENGKKWKQKMNNTYGYILGTKGKDGDHLDMFINDNADLDSWNGNVYVVDQVFPDGSFDEHKVMYGFDSEEEARKAYLSNYEQGWQGLGNITGVSKEDFDRWLEKSGRKTKAFSEYKNVKSESAESPKTGAFGTIYTQFKGKPQEAIAFLLEKKEGEAVGALHHKDIGDIDLVWGKEGTAKSDGFGLAKLAKYHPEVLGNLQEILDAMVVVKRTDNRVQLESETHQASVRLTWDSEKKNWLLTAFEKKNSVSDNTTDTVGTAEGGKRNDTATPQNTVSDGKDTEKDSSEQENEEKKAGGDRPLYASLGVSRSLGKEAAEGEPRWASSSLSTPRGKETAEGDRETTSVRLQKSEGYSEFADKHGVSVDDVRRYAEGMALGNLALANQAIAEIRRSKRHEHRGTKLSEFVKLFAPLKNELYERFGDMDELQQEYVRRAEEKRNMMEAARRKAAEEERKRQARLEELSLLDDAAVDERYMDALQKGDEATAREMLDEAARRKGYGDTTSDYQGVGAWSAPSDPGYESDAARRADVESNAPDVNLEDMALGYNLQPDDYFIHPERYSQNTPYGLESTRAIQSALEALKRGEKDVKMKVYRAVPTSVKEGKLRNGDWVTPSKKYAEMHGNNRLEGKYRIIEDEVPVSELWWDGNDANEWGYDNGKGYKYKNVKNNRKSDALVTRDDKGAVIPPSKRFNQRKADERYQRGVDGVKPSKAEVALRDAVIDRLRENGMEVITDVAEGQRVLDEANGMVRLMGSRTNKKMKEIADVLSEHELSEQQRTVVDVYSGKTDNLQLELSRNDGSRRIVIRQGNDNKAGTKHSVYRHYGTTEGVITAEDILLIPEVLNRGERKSIKRGNTQLYEYVLRNVDGAEYTVLTEINNRGKETFADFYSNKKVSSTARKTRSSEAQARLDETLSAAKVEEKSKTANKSGEKLREQRVYHGSGADGLRFFRTANGEAYGFTVGGKIYVDPRIATSETPVHEYAHLWASALRNGNAEEWQNVVGLMKDSKVWDEVKGRYPELKTDDEIADEVIATYSGRRGAERLREEQRKIAEGNGGVFEKVEAISALEHVKRALKMFWKGVADFLHIHYKSAEEVADRVMKDLLEGVDPRKMGETKDGGVRFNAKQKRALETASLGNAPRSLTVVSSATGAKILNSIDKLVESLEKSATQPKTFIGNVAKALGASRFGSGSEYATFETKNGDIVTIRLANHNAHVSGFDHNGKDNGISIVISPKPNEGITNDGNAHITEFYYDSIKLRRADGKPLAEIVRSIKQALYSGEFKDTTGLAERQEVNGEDVIRYQFIGEKGAAEADHAEEVSVRLDNLSVAREMEAEKKDAKAIKMATGWERGADGKWRYEIADMKEFDRNGNLLYRKHHPDYARYIELQDKDLKNLLEDGEELTDKEREEYEALSKKYESDKFGGEKLDNIHTLEAYVDAPELFKAYPELRNVRVTFKDTGGWETASYYAISDVIDFNVDDVGEIVVNTGKVTANMRTKELKSVFLHEIQHAIQVIEGFAEGGSPQYMKGLYSDYFLQDYSSSQLHELAELRRIAENKVKRGEYKRMSYAVKNVIKAAKEHGFYPTWAESFDNNPNSVTTVYDTLVKFPSEILDKAVLIDERDLYNRVAGEVEARNVQERMGMSAEERRASLAAETEDVAREDQIFLMGDGVSEMGSRTYKQMQEISNYYDGIAMSDEERTLIDVFSGKNNHQNITFTDNSGHERKMELSQGREESGGTKHAIYRHLNKAKNFFTIDEIKLIKDVLSIGERSVDGVRITYSLEKDGVLYTVGSRNRKGKEEFITFYTNREASSPGASNTQKSARADSENASSAAKVGNVSETAKESEGKDRRRYASLGVSRQFGEEAAEAKPRYASSSLSEQQLDGDDTIRFSLRQEPAPKVTKKGYAVFIYKKLKNGGYKLVPKMLSNDPGAPAQTWLNADTGYMKRDENGEPLQNTNGRASVSVNGSQAGGNKSNKLAWRPGKHLAMYPNASQFKSPDGTIPKDVIFFEVEYAADPDLHKQYQRNAWELGMNDNGQYRNNQGGLPYIPKDSYYLYRTNSISEGATPMIITGAYKINRALTDAEAKELNQNAGGMWCPRKGGDLTEEKLKDMGLDDKGLKKMTESFDMDTIKESHDESDEARLLPGYKSREINWEDKDLIHSIEENGQDINDYRDGYVAPEHAEEPTIRFSLDKDKGTVVSPSKPSKAEAVLRDAVIDRLRENGMEVITDVAEGQRVLDEANGRGKLQMGDAPETFAERQKQAVENRGVVMPGLNETYVEVVKDIPRHGYTGTIAEATREAIDAAKRKYAGKELTYNNYGVNFNYTISANAIEICLSPKHQNLSANKGIHLALAEHLEEVINNSIEVEEHPDYVKNNGTRGNNGSVNTEALMHRFYGVAVIDGTPFRIMTLMREGKDSATSNGIHSYAVQKIEVLDNDLPSTSNGVGSIPQVKSGSLYPLAKLLKGVEKAYDKGKYLLEESKKRSAGLREQRVGGADGVRFFRTANGEAYGFTVGGKIYVDPRIATSETPVHEYAHLWATALRNGNAEEWQNVVGLMKDSKVWDEVKGRYPELKTDDEIADEVIATYSGRRGAERLREEQRKIAEGDGGVFEKAEAISALESVKRVLKMFWKGVADFLHIHYKNAEEVADRVMKDLLDGVDPRMRENVEDVDEINDAFNEELQQQIDGKLSSNHIYRMGRPGRILLSTGVPDLPIQMNASRLKAKATSYGHDFELSEIKDLVKALQTPLAVFSYGDKTKAQNIIVPLQKDGKNFMVGLSLNPTVGGRSLEINSIRNVFPKNNSEWLNWISQGKALYLDKEKVQTLIDQQRTILADVEYLDLNSVAKIVESFENPKFSDEKFGEGEPSYASLSLSEQQLDGDDTIRFSLNYDKWNSEMASWLKRNRLPKNAQRPVVPQREIGESDLHFAGRLAKYNQDKALWNTAPKYEGHLSSGMTARGEFNYELQRGSVLTRIAVQDSMLAIRKAQEAIARHSGLLKVGTFEDAYMAENNSHGKAKNEFEQYDQEYLAPLRKWFNVMMKRLDGSYNNVTNYMIAKHGLERNAHMAFMAALEAEAKKAIDNTRPDAKRLRAQMVHDAYKQYKADSRRLINDADYQSGKYDYAQWRRTDDAIRKSYCSNYESFRYNKGGVVRDYAGLSSLFQNETDFEEKAAEMCADIEGRNGQETSELWDAVRQATRQILKNSHDAGMMSDETYDYVRGMYEHYIPLRGWNDSAADEVWDYAGGGRGVFNAALKEAHGRQSLADDPVAYIMNMAESGFLVNNKNWVKQHFLMMAMNHPSDLLTVSKAWYVKSKDQFGNEVWIPASPNIPVDETDPAVIQAALDAFQTKMEQMEQSGDATRQRGSLNIEYPQTKSEEREHEVRVMKDGEEYVIYVNGDPQLAQALNNTRAMRVRQHEGNFEKACAWLGRKMAAVYTSLSPLFVPSNWARDTTMTLASTAIREDARYNWLLRTKFMRPDVQMRMFGLVKEYQNGKLREKVKSRTATKTEENFWNFMINGGETGFVSTMDVDAFREKIQRDLKDMGRTRLNPVKVGHAIADSVEYINRVIEDSNRFAIYQTSIEYGRGIEEAVQDAKNVTLNFNRKGTGEMGMSAIRQLYLFINPAIQSLQTLGALAKDHKAKFTAVTSAWMASGMLVPLFNELMFNLASAAAGGGGDDDDEFNPKEEYWKFSSFDRRNNCILWIPFTHNFIKIPLAPEFRGFYGIGDMVASAMWGGENAKESWSNYAADLMGQIIDLSPLDPVSYDGNVLVSLMPNAIRPLVEIAQNVTFTGKPIYRESDFNKYDPSFKKAYAGTPDFLLRYSKWINSIGNKYPEAQQGPVEQTAVGRYANNPAVIDHLLKSYLGGMYTLGSQIAGAITKASDEETRKDFKTADIPFFSKFVANPNDRPQSKNKGDAYWQDFEKYQRSSHTLGVIRQDARKTGNFSVLEDFYRSEEYKEMKEYEPKAKQRKEEQKYERWKEEGNADLYQPHQQTGEDVYKRHSTPADDFEDTKASILYQKIRPAKDIFDMADINTPSGMDTFNKYYDLAGKVEEAQSVKKKMNAIVKSFVNDEHKAAFDPEKMKEYRALRKQYVQLVEDGNRMFEKIKAQRN